MKVVVAMSGGVDSSVAAALLVEAGHQVIGVHLRQHDGQGAETPTPRCCGITDAADARRVAEQLGIEYHEWDLREVFDQQIITHFTDSYIAGATPSPCIRCNSVVRFGVLMDRALALGADRLATGHYARITSGSTLRFAADRNKDQTYFLFDVSPEALARTLFPLGGLTKTQVRAEAERLGLRTRHKPESQEICFVPCGDHARFVSHRRPEVDGAGDIVDADGRVIGHHDAYWRYTIGQRRGLGVAVGRPVYVTEIDPVQRRVTLGEAADVRHRSIRATGWRWHRTPGDGDALVARVRHNGRLTPCSVAHDGGDDVQLTLAEPAWAAARGQAVVVYAADELLGGGWIEGARP